MRKDIQIPEVKNVHVAVVQEYNSEFEWNDWNAYIINNRMDAIEGVLIVSKGYDEHRKTSTMRHSFPKIEAKSFAKIELMQEDVLSLNNEFQVTFFAGGMLYDKKFLFRKNTINVKALQNVPNMKLRGVLVQ
ncbi:hypothetical protein ABN763_05120 [Spongiivirga sp. MCCC 1A20706]|uniref:hypothetical protein n=1 Tax=Spongiivirga sp. MCCC 1A20706 TaxID=3160963 RepID=UPI0039772F86